jgi:hypothetical protein
MRPIPTIAALQFGVFTAAQAIEAGWTSHALRYAVRTGQLVRIRHSVYALAPHADEDATTRLQRRAAALSLTHPELPLSHAAAAALLDIPLHGPVPALPCVTVSRGYTGDIDAAHVHRNRSMDGRHVMSLGRIRVLDAARTVVDIGRERGVDGGLVAADAALAKQLVTPADLRAVVRECEGWPGMRAATEAVEFADARSESPLESISRRRMAQCGVPRPRLQVRLAARMGGLLGRVDFYWDEAGVVGEADGMTKYVGDVALREEKLRQERLERSGLIVVRWGWPDLARFDDVAARLNGAIRRGRSASRPDRDWREVLDPAGYRGIAVDSAS